jgi:hypothetical protein
MRRLLPSIDFNTKSGASLPTSVGAAAIDEPVNAVLKIKPPASNSLRMR